MPTEAAANADAANAVVEPIKPAPIALPAAQAADDPNNPPWLPERLARERKSAAKDAEIAARKSLLEEMGFADIDVAKKLAAEEKKRAEAQKSLETKLAERDTKLSTAEARLNELNLSVKGFADEQVQTLSESQRKAVLELAGNDPAKQLKAIATLRPTWGNSLSDRNQTTTQTSANASSSTTNQTTQTSAGKPAPATAPGATAPPAGGGPPVVPNHLEMYEMLNNQSSPDYKPFAASKLLLAHSKEIAAARTARGSN